MKGKNMKKNADDAIGNLIKSIVSGAIGNEEEIADENAVTKDELQNFATELTKTIGETVKGIIVDLNTQVADLKKSVDVKFDELKKNQTVDPNTNQTADPNANQTVDPNATTAAVSKALDKDEIAELIAKAIGDKFDAMASSLNGKNMRKSLISLDENGNIVEKGVREVDIDNLTVAEWDALPDATRKQLTKSVYASMLK